MSNRVFNSAESREREENDVRVEDYLDDKLQTHADLENLDSLLQNVKYQQELLRQQLVNAESDLDHALTTAHRQKSEISEKTRRFKQQQKEIDRRLLIVTNSDTSDDAARKFGEGMQKLDRLNVAKTYVELLSKVGQLSDEAQRNFKTSHQAALKSYIQLQNITSWMKAAQPAAEYAAPHLVDHVESTTKSLWSQMKFKFSSDFETTLSKMKWPGKDVNMEGGLADEWTEGVIKLLELQAPELEAYEDNRDNIGSTRGPLVLLPLEVMVKPLELRFKYHFEGDRPTNKLDKPEFFLQHITGLLNTYENFFSIYLQPSLQIHFQGSELALNPIFVDSTTAFITALLPMVKQKILQLLPQTSQHPQLMSHLMHELMSFDTSLKDDWGYNGGGGSEGWKGLAWNILVHESWFDRWLQVEKDFALSRYDEIIEPADSGQIDYDSVDPGVTKPTKAAIRVNDLLETVTERYKPLSSFSQKLRFLIDIQISIFDRFHARLHSSLEAYLTMTSSIGRTMQGVSKEDQASLQGLGGLDRLCRIYGSADYLEKKMRDWSDDVFFLELWEELQYRARNNARDGSTVVKDMSVEAVAERTSSSVGSDGVSGALFDETSSAYHRLRVRAEDVIVETISYNIRESLKPYGKINPWSSISPDSSVGAITAELDNTVQHLSSYLSFLRRVLSDASLRRFCRPIVVVIQTSIWDHVLMAHNFSAPGVVQLQRDVAAIWELFDRFTTIGFGTMSMRRLTEALELLSLPYVSGEADEGLEAPSGVPSIKMVEEQVYRDNESAREILEKLGMEALSESDARHVLDKRVELGL